MKNRKRRIRVADGRTKTAEKCDLTLVKSVVVGDLEKRQLLPYCGSGHMSLAFHKHFASRNPTPAFGRAISKQCNIL